jgi:hypothetical protein
MIIIQLAAQQTKVAGGPRTPRSAAGGASAFTAGLGPTLRIELDLSFDLNRNVEWQLGQTNSASRVSAPLGTVELDAPATRGSVGQQVCGDWNTTYPSHVRTLR